jgi:hypothetical protein
MIDISSGHPPISHGLFAGTEREFSTEETAMFGQIFPDTDRRAVSFFPSRGTYDGSCR